MAYSTEITSDKIASDNPIHQRLLKAYYLAQPFLNNHILEIGCGEGRGVDFFTIEGVTYTGIDKNPTIINHLKAEHPDLNFYQMVIPPLKGLEENAFDLIVCFQVIEHIKDDGYLVREIHRVLKPGGRALITTPNRLKSLTRNPWHIREYKANQLRELLESVFPKVEMQGISGNQKVMEYIERNKLSVQKITKWDIFNLQYRLPSFMLRVPYELLNRVNRNRLKDQDDQLVKDISHQDYVLDENLDECLDFFCVVEK